MYCRREVTGGNVGLVVSKLGTGWSRPFSIGCFRVGAGLQIGGQLMDAVIILPDIASVEAFAGNLHLGISGTASASLGVGSGLGKVVSLKVDLRILIPLNCSGVVG